MRKPGKTDIPVSIDSGYFCGYYKLPPGIIQVVWNPLSHTFYYNGIQLSSYRSRLGLPHQSKPFNECVTLHKKKQQRLKKLKNYLNKA